MAISKPERTHRDEDRNYEPPDALRPERSLTRVIVAVLIVAVALPSIQPGQAQPSRGKRSWTEEKCRRYKRDFAEALRRWGPAEVSRAFIEGNKAFIESGCESGVKVCPQSARERELVDVLTIRVVNEGMSSTFLPFACGG